MQARSRCSARSLFRPHDSGDSDAGTVAYHEHVEERVERLAAQVRQAGLHVLAAVQASHLLFHLPTMPHLAL